MRVGLRTRVVLTTSLVLLIGLALGGWVLVRSFSASVVAGAEEQLRLVVYGLLGAADVLDQQLSFASDFAEPRFVLPESGLYALVENAARETLWRSPSLQMTELEGPNFSGLDEPGRFDFRADERFFYMSYQVIWEDAGEVLLTFRVFTSRAPYLAEIAGFQRTLTMGVAGVVLLLIVAQYLAVAWGINPVNVMAQRVRDLETGHRQRLGEDFPAELIGLARNLDRFIVHEADSRDRYRRAMDDLAHTLKTPLAVLRNGLAERQTDADGLLSEQLDRMETAVSYQLSRAVAAPSPMLTVAVPLAVSTERICNALNIAYASKKVLAEQRIDADLAVRVSEGDLLEMLGNVIENGFKYCGSRVRVSAHRKIAGDSGGSRVVVVVEDDGDGIDPSLRDQVLARGARADTAAPGQGIGLAVVVELLNGYGGTLGIDGADLGGARISFNLPAG
jgi:two-component system sensor histidine kinase PhoQ